MLSPLQPAFCDIAQIVPGKTKNMVGSLKCLESILIAPCPALKPDHLRVQATHLNIPLTIMMTLHGYAVRYARAKAFAIKWFIRPSIS